MKKTFKVKNILKNKNKYNFKTELLLSALSLLVAFGTVSCKKDPVKPKNNTENPVVPPKDTIDTELENAKKAYELAKKDSISSVNNIKNTIEVDLKKLDSINKDKNSYSIYDKFYRNTVGNLIFPSFKDTVAGTNFKIVNPEPNVSYSYIKTDNIGYIGGSKKMLKKGFTKEELDLIQKILNLSNQYLEILPSVEEKRIALNNIKKQRTR